MNGHSGSREITRVSDAATPPQFLFFLWGLSQAGGAGNLVAGVFNAAANLPVGAVKNRYHFVVRHVFCWLIASALSALAQTNTDADIAAKLVKDLLPAETALTWPDPLKDGVYTRTELQSLATSGLRAVMNTYEADLRELERRHRGVISRPEEASLVLRSFSSPDQAYKLAYALTGKEMSQTTLLPVCEAIVQMVVASLECRDTLCHLQESSDFRSAAENAWKTLQSIGVDGRDLRYVMDSFFRGAAAAAAPPLKTGYKYE